MPHYQQLIDHPDRKINEEIMDLNDTIEKMDLTNIQRTFRLGVENTFFLSAHRKFFLFFKFPHRSYVRP